MSYEMRLVTWADSIGSQGGWQTVEDAMGEQPMTCHTVGFVVKETDEFVTLVQSYHGPDGEERIDNYMCIPKATIKKSKVLK